MRDLQDQLRAPYTIIYFDFCFNSSYRANQIFLGVEYDLHRKNFSITKKTILGGVPDFNKLRDLLLLVNEGSLTNVLKKHC
uniref:Uncharacterized protein n=1 Tax=Lepeophtheirus salmonis TaxID=72036 RepID=A0A0K2VE50_LEPSM